MCILRGAYTHMFLRGLAIGNFNTFLILKYEYIKY